MVRTRPAHKQRLHLTRGGAAWWVDEGGGMRRRWRRLPDLGDGCDGERTGAGSEVRTAGVEVGEGALAFALLAKWQRIHLSGYAPGPRRVRYVREKPSGAPESAESSVQAHWWWSCRWFL